jgi:hypothetical protein
VDRTVAVKRLLDVGKAAAAPSGTFFVRVCQAIDWANDRSRISILRRHLSQIENPRLRNAFRAAVGPEAAGAPRSLQTSSPRIPLEGAATLSNTQSSDGCVASWSQFICPLCKGLAIRLDDLRRSGPYFTGPGSLEPTGARFVLAHEVSIRRPAGEGRCRMIAAEQACAPHPTLHRMLSERGATLVAALSIAFVGHSCNLAEQLTLYRRAIFSMRTWHFAGARARLREKWYALLWSSRRSKRDRPGQ